MDLICLDNVRSSSASNGYIQHKVERYTDLA